MTNVMKVGGRSPTGWPYLLEPFPFIYSECLACADCKPFGWKQAAEVLLGDCP
jgi:hypothetical protein